MFDLHKVFPKNDWLSFFCRQANKPYFKELNHQVGTEYKNNMCEPLFNLIFLAFKKCSLSNLKVIIFGQEPYFQKNQATGLAFACNNQVAPSLRNIIENVQKNFSTNSKILDKYLLSWAEQGVLLLNSFLTVEVNRPLSHKNINWNYFLENLLSYIIEMKNRIVVFLWGNFAHKLEKNFVNTKFLVLKTTHPSPLSCYRGFKASKQFLLANQYLSDNKLKPINWCSVLK